MAFDSPISTPMRPAARFLAWIYQTLLKSEWSSEKKLQDMIQTSQFISTMTSARNLQAAANRFSLANTGGNGGNTVAFKRAFASQSAISYYLRTGI